MRCKYICVQSVLVCAMVLAVYVLGVSSVSAETVIWDIVVVVGSEERTGSVSVVVEQLDTTVSLDLGAGGFNWYANKAWPLVLPETMTIRKGANKGELAGLVIELDEFQGKSMITNGFYIAVDSCLHILTALRVLPRNEEDVHNEFGTFRAERTTLSGADIVVSTGGGKVSPPNC